ncbi:MAG: GTPase, partial [Thermoguttaceae bacterium]
FPCPVAGSLRLPGIHSPLPCEVYVWYAATERVRSYTGQPVAEIHTLGSPPLLQLVLRSLGNAGARMAGPGEFTLRAFLAGRIDLGQAEAVLGIIDAANPAELRLALGQLAGGLARPLNGLRESLLELLAHLEAGFDFADEDLSFISREELDRRLAEAEDQLTAISRQMASRGETASLLRVVLTGQPNSGKSSLWNALVGGGAALVSDRPGTTRDYLTAELDLGGVRCQLVDTAGVESGEWRVDKSEAVRDADAAAQRAAAEQHHAADIELLCLDTTGRLKEQAMHGLQCESPRQRITVLTKCDLATTVGLPSDGLRTSSRTGQGIERLRGRLREAAIAAGGRAGVLAGTALRCEESLRLAGQSIGLARRVADHEELAAAEVRVALEELGKVTGAVHTDDVLDRIFSRFCVGK